MTSSGSAVGHGGSAIVWPKWVGWVLASMATVFVVAVAVNPGVPHRPVLVPVLLGVVTIGWYLEMFEIWLPMAVRAGVTLAVVGTINVAADQLDFVGGHDGAQVTLMLLLLMVGEVVAVGPLWLVGVVVAAAAVITSPPVLPYDFDGEYIWIVALALSVMVGVFLRALVRALTELEAAQQELASQAARDERRRIAREVHDVVAHSLTVTMLHLTAARLAVGRGDTVDATEALEEAERAGRQSLADVRRTVGLLRADDERAPSTQPADDVLRPMPRANDLPRLVADYRAAGVPVELSVSGELAAIDPTVSLAVYRIVQESLANVARHAPGAAATVSISVTDPVLVRVDSTGGNIGAAVAASGSGSGLVGMRERAEALGGRCTAGPCGDGWTVEASLPRPSIDTRVAP